MSLADYAYSNTRIRVMRSLLLSEKEIDSFSRASSLEGFIMSLRQTPYGELFSKIEKITPQEVEQYLTIDLLRTITKVSMISPKDCRPFINAVSKKYELEYVKFVLNSLAGNTPSDKITGVLPASESGQLFAGGGVEEFLERLADMSLNDIRSSLFERYSNLDRFMPSSPELLDMLVALDKYCFSELSKAVEYLSGGGRKTAAMLLSLEIEGANIITVLRAAARGFDASRFIIPGGGYYLKDLDRYVIRDELDKYGVRHVSSVLEKLLKTPYGQVIKESVATYAETKSLLPVELSLKRYLAKQGVRIMAKQPFEIGFILGYVKLKEMEVDDLRAIAVGIGEGLPAGKVGMLLLTPVL
ncbi:MAG: V-type ATPase subunit [Candidatus Altiarchaeota archaeon]|nr:V-type ATPase subunit [Candidatus Altiarchaeota archaeon]